MFLIYCICVIVYVILRLRMFVYIYVCAGFFYECIVLIEMTNITQKYNIHTYISAYKSNIPQLSLYTECDG